jgi:hypothetical protein
MEDVHKGKSVYKCRILYSHGIGVENLLACRKLFILIKHNLQISPLSSQRSMILNVPTL